MTDQHSLCLFNEGRITLPAGYQDRTVNVFTLPGADSPAFNIARDHLDPHETLDAYIDRQLLLMAEHLNGWQQAERGAATLGDMLLQGQQLHTSFLRDGKRIWQQQAVFTADNRNVLVFTMTSTTALNEAMSARFRTLLRSFSFHT